jgi:hypothetical protein
MLLVGTNSITGQQYRDQLYVYESRDFFNSLIIQCRVTVMVPGAFTHLTNSCSCQMKSSWKFMYQHG